MIALFLFILFGVVFGFFATLNTIPITIYLGITVLENVPLYFALLSCLTIGVIFASLFYAIESFGRRRIIGEQKQKLEQVNREKAELLKKNHQLELENTRLKTQNGEEEQDEHSL